MTPRMMAAYLFLADKRRKRRLYEELYYAAVANCGDGKLIKKQMDDMEREF
jgi:hypothetical protein